MFNHKDLIEEMFKLVNPVEMKTTIDLYYIYAEKFNSATNKYEINQYANICGALLNRIRELEKQLIIEYKHTQGENYEKTIKE